MEWQFIVALIVAIPIILFPAAFVWYLNIGGIFSRVRQAAEEKEKAAAAEKAKGITK
jgi:hypothetical protein